jgi:hypothetical protein
MLTDLNFYVPIPGQSLCLTMSSSPLQGLGERQSEMLRALKALPFLGITAAAMYFMWGVSRR